MGIPVFFNNFTTADVTSALSGHSLDLPTYHPLKTINFLIKCIFSALILSRNKIKLK